MKRIDKHNHIAKKLMASALALTLCIPYVADSTYSITKSLIANAAGGGDGTGSDSSAGGIVTNYGYDGWSLGYRFYIVDKDGNLKTHACDVLPSTFRFKADTRYNYSKATRFGTLSAIDRWSISELDPILQDIPVWTGDNPHANGETFKNWMMQIPNGSKYDHRELLIGELFGTETFKQFANKNYYLIMEPVTCIPYFTGYTVGSYSGYALYGSWWGTMYGFKALGTPNGGFMMSRTSVYGNAFRIANNYETLGLTKTPGSNLPDGCTINNLDSGSLRGFGYGMEIFWPSQDPTGDLICSPINSYDIDTNPSAPSKSETPSVKPSDPNTPAEPKKTTIDNHTVELKNSGDTNIIKVYMDAYVDKQNSPDINKNYSGDELNNNYYTTKKKYTGIEQVGVYGTKSTTKEVVVQDEFSESGYHLVGWETSLSDWEVSGNNIVLANTSGSEAWNGNNWLQVNSGELKINEGLLRKKGTSPTATTDKNRARYNTTNITTSRSKIGTVEGADSVVNHKWDYKATDGAIVGK